MNIICTLDDHCLRQLWRSSDRRSTSMQHILQLVGAAKLTLALKGWLLQHRIPSRRKWTPQIPLWSTQLPHTKVTGFNPTFRISSSDHGLAAGTHVWPERYVDSVRRAIESALDGGHVREECVNHLRSGSSHRQKSSSVASARYAVLSLGLE